MCTDMDGNIVKIAGPFPAGFYPDQVVFLEETMAALDIDEKCEGDEGLIEFPPSLPSSPPVSPLPLPPPPSSPPPPL